MTGIEHPDLERMREPLAERLQADFALSLVEPERIPIPGLAAGILGHLQADDGSGGRIAFYLRPHGSSPLVPQYLSSLARASYTVQATVRVCIVIEDESEAAANDARACGAGLLLLTDEELTQLVEPAPPTEDLSQGELDELAEQTRRQIVSTAQLAIRAQEQEYHEASRVVDRDSPNGKKLLRDIKRAAAQAEGWQTDRLEDHRRAVRRRDVDALRALHDDALNDDPIDG